MTDSPTKPAQPPLRENWFAEFWWIVAAAYLVGLFSRKGWEAWWGFPSTDDLGLLAVDQIVFGGLIIGYYLLCFAVVFSLRDREPVRRARDEWQRLRESGVPPIRGVARLVTQVVILYALDLLFPPIAGVFAIFVLTSGDLQLTAIAAMTLFSAHAATVLVAVTTDRRRRLQEPTPTIDAFARLSILGARPLPAHMLMIAFSGLSLFSGAILYPLASQAAGGGRPIAVHLQLESALTSSSDSIVAHADSTWLLKRTSDYLIVRAARGSTDDAIVLLPQARVRSIRAFLPQWRLRLERQRSPGGASSPISSR